MGGEKNTHFTPSRFTDLFNSIINTLGLREIHMQGGLYTWSNNHACPTMEKLDRVLMSPDWEDLFPLVTVRKIVKEISDHNPLILDSGDEVININKKGEFKFDISWLKHNDFLPLVK